MGAPRPGGAGAWRSSLVAEGDWPEFHRHLLSQGRVCVALRSAHSGRRSGRDRGGGRSRCAFRGGRSCGLYDRHGRVSHASGGSRGPSGQAAGRRFVRGRRIADAQRVDGAVPAQVDVSGAARADGAGACGGRRRGVGDGPMAPSARRHRHRHGRIARSASSRRPTAMPT